MTPLKSADPDSADDRFRSYAPLQIIIARWKIIITELFPEKALFSIGLVIECFMREGDALRDQRRVIKAGRIASS